MNILPGQSILANSVNARVHLDTQHRGQKQAGLDAYSSILHNKDWQESREMLIRSFQREGSNNQSEAPVLNLFRPSATNLLERRCPESAALAMIAFACKVFGDKIFEDGQPDPPRIRMALHLLFAQQMPDCRNDIEAMLSSVTYNAAEGMLNSSHYHIQLPTVAPENTPGELSATGIDYEYIEEVFPAVIIPFFSDPTSIPDFLKPWCGKIITNAVIEAFREQNVNSEIHQLWKSWSPLLTEEDNVLVINKTRADVNKMRVEREQRMLQRNEIARSRTHRQKEQADHATQLNQKFLNQLPVFLASTLDHMLIQNFSAAYRLNNADPQTLTKFFASTVTNSQPNSTLNQETAVLYLAALAIRTSGLTNIRLINQKDLKRLYENLSTEFELPSLPDKLFDDLWIGSVNKFSVTIGTKNLRIKLPIGGFPRLHDKIDGLVQPLDTQLAAAQLFDTQLPATLMQSSESSNGEELNGPIPKPELTRSSTGQEDLSEQDGS